MSWVNGANPDLHCNAFYVIEEGPMVKKNTKTYCADDELNHMKRCLNICAGLRKDREDGLFCDVTLLVQDEKFPVHKTVLKACSSYFRAMFTGPFSERNQSEIHIQGISSDVFAVLLDYMYGAKIEITFEKLREIFFASDMLHISDLIVECENFAKNEWASFKDVQHVYQMAKELCLKDVTASIIQWGLHHLVTWDLKSEDHYYREVNVSFMLNVLEGRQKDDNQLHDESLVAKYLVKWVFHKPEERFPDLAFRIFTVIRFQFLSKQDFIDVLRLIRAFGAVNSGVLNRFVTYLQDMYKMSRQKLFDLHVTPVLVDAEDNTIGSDVKFYQFCFQDWKWETTLIHIPDLPESCVINKNDLYMFTIEGCTKVNLQTKAVDDLPMFPEERTKSVYSVINDNFYVTGGYKDGTDQRLADILKLTNGQWTACGVWSNPKLETRSIAHGEYIYFVGGWSRSQNEMAECFSYHTISRLFQKVCNLSFSVSRAKIAIYDDILYVFNDALCRVCEVGGIDLNRQEQIPQSDLGGLNLMSFPVCGVTSVQSGLLIAYEVTKHILLVIYRPSQEQDIEFLGIVPEPVLDGEFQELLFSSHLNII